MPAPDEIIHDKLDKELLERITGIELPKRTLGYWVTLKIYIPKGFGIKREKRQVEPVQSHLISSDGSTLLKNNPQPEPELELAIPEEYQRMKKYRQCVGLVLATGGDAYNAPKFKSNWVEVGQWVLFNLNSAVFRPLYKGIPMVVVPDDALLWEVEDPDDVGTW
jgi:hypothetical protein